MTTEVESFLKAEEAVNSLLRNMEQLKTEVEGYSRAKSSLDEVRGQLANLIRSIGPVADQISTVIRTLDKVGTPEILREVAALTSLNEKSLKAVDAMEYGLAGATSRLEGTLQKDVTENKSFLNAVAAETKAQVASIRDAASQSIAVIKQESVMLGKSLSEQIDTMQRHVDQQATSIKRLFGIVVVVIAIAASAIVYVINGR